MASFDAINHWIAMHEVLAKCLTVLVYVVAIFSGPLLSWLWTRWLAVDEQLAADFEDGE